MRQSVAHTTLPAVKLINEIATRAGLHHSRIVDLFVGAPMDFTIHFGPHLPLRIDALGMVGITLAGHVYLLNNLRCHDPLRLLAIVRHEAEHVGQQRLAPLRFYPFYALGWLWRFIIGASTQASLCPTRHRRWLAQRWYTAYRSLPYEVAAYAAEERARQRLHIQ